MSNIIIRPMRGGGDPLVEFTSSLGVESKLLVEPNGALSFSGAPTKHEGGLSGSLQRLSDGNSYLLAGVGVTLLTNSLGQVQISSTGQPGGSDTYIQFNDGGSFGGDSGLTFNKNTDTLNVTNVVVAGDLTVNGTMTTVNTTNLEVKDAIIGLGFASASVEQVSGDRGLVMALDGENNAAFLWKNIESEFVLAKVDVSSTGTLPVSLTSYSNLHVENIQASIITASLGFSGSLTKLVDGSDYLLPGTGITISTGSNGSITITSTAITSPASPDTGVQYNNGGSFAASSNFTYNGSGAFLTGTLAQGNGSIASGISSHAEGYGTLSQGQDSHAEGYYGISKGSNSHSEGRASFSIGPYSHAEGKATQSGVKVYNDDGNGVVSGVVTLASNSELLSTQFNSSNVWAIRLYRQSDGWLSEEYSSPNVVREMSDPSSNAYLEIGNAALNIAGPLQVLLIGVEFDFIKLVSVPGPDIFGSNGNHSHAEGWATVAYGDYSHAEGVGAISFGQSSHSEGHYTVAQSQYSHAEGYYTIASNTASHSEGDGTVASGVSSHAEGISTIASGSSSHAEGNSSLASGSYSHAEGYITIALGDGSHVEGYLTVTSGTYSHSEGVSTIAEGEGSHAEGLNTKAFGANSHAAGISTVASGSGQNVVGKYNLRGNTDSLFIIGNGDDDVDARRSDIFLVNSGSVMIGSGSLASDTFLYVGTKGIATNVRMDGNLVVSGTFDVKNGSDASVLSVNGSNVGIGTSSPTYKLEVVGDFAATTKSFVIDHPNKTGWKLRHGSLEGPENGIYVRGRTSGKEIVLPGYWKDLVDESSITVQITPVGSRFDFFVSSMDVNKVTVEFDADGVEYCYLVQASRKDEVFVVEFESK
jgi:hypothetical protein